MSDFVSGTLIRSADVNSWLDDLGSEVTNSIAKDGQTTPIANLPMGGFKHTDVADASADNQYASYGQLKWRLISDAAITAVSQIDVTWGAGDYRALQIHVLGATPSAGSLNANLYAQVRHGASWLTSATDYYAQGYYIDGITWAAWRALMSAIPMTLGGIPVVPDPISGVVDLDLGDTGRRGGATATTRWVANSGERASGVLGTQVMPSTAPASGVRLFFGDSATFAAVGRFVIWGVKA